MTVTPRLLDLFCGAGGAAVGYDLAGFHVTGIDNRPQPRYPFAFVQADALAYLAEHGHEFDAIHASPPCQRYTSLRSINPERNHPALVGATRAALIANGRPWAIENVVGAPLAYYVQLCGTMFGLRVYRHRRFETSLLVMQPPHPAHRRGNLIDLFSDGKRRQFLESDRFVTVTGNCGAYVGPAMGIDWMTGAELSQAIPPAYTEWIGGHLLAAVAGKAASPR